MKFRILILTGLITFIANAQKPQSYWSQIDSLKKLPESFETCKSLGDLYKKIGNYKPAIYYLQKAGQIKSEPEVQKKLANLWIAKGYPEKAVSILEKVIEQDSLDLSASFGLSKLYAALHQNDKALKLLEDLEQKDPENPWFTYQRAKLITDDGNLKLDAYLAAYRKDTTWLKPIYAIAQIYKQIKFYDSAYYFIRKGLALRPRHNGLLTMKVVESYRKKNYVAMNKILKSMDSMRIRPFFTHKMLGLNYYLLNKYPQGLEHLEKALDLNDEDPDLYLYKSYILSEQKKYKQAEKMLQMSIRLKHKSLDTEYYQLGLIATKRHNYKKAIGLYYKAYKENSHNSEALFQWTYTSDLYFKDKKITLKRYQKFLDYPYGKKEQREFALNRVKALKLAVFMGEE